MVMLDSYKHRLRKAAAAFCAAAFLLGSVPAARAASVCPPPQVSAACAALIDGRTGQTLYEKNADRRALIASTTKIMTGLLVCEAGEADRRVTVPAAAVGLEGSSMYLKRGETLTRQDLLYGMMLHSGNDAALTLAISVSGSEQAFVRQMNLRAQALGLRQTHFANPHGLDSGENYSSARDLAALTQAALQNQQFRTVVGTKTITCAGRTLTNHNKLLWRYDGCIGVKTGYTRHAGRILVSAAERGESQLIAVRLGFAFSNPIWIGSGAKSNAADIKEITYDGGQVIETVGNTMVIAAADTFSVDKLNVKVSKGATVSTEVIDAVDGELDTAAAVKITVTAEDGTKAVETVFLTKGEPGESTAEIVSFATTFVKTEEGTRTPPHKVLSKSRMRHFFLFKAIFCILESTHVANSLVILEDIYI